MTNPVETARKLNVHETLRRRPGRLLNVLCTFNLHPVSTGKVLQDTVNIKQLLIVIPFLGYQSFLVRKRLQSSIRHHLEYCSLRIVLQSKAWLSSLFCFKDIIHKEINLYAVAVMQLIIKSQKETLYIVRASEQLGMTPLTGKWVKSPKKFGYHWPHPDEVSRHHFWKILFSLE